MTPPQIAVDTPIGPDVDLDREDVRLASGIKLTSELAKQIADEVQP